jgi:hypothetical protein
MKKIILFTVVVLFSTSIISFLRKSDSLKKEKLRAEFMGKRKGDIEKLTFIAGKEITLTGTKDTLWYISSYELGFSCSGSMVLKQYKGEKLDKEILKMVKDCKANSAIADFRFIMAKNKLTGKEIQLNNIELQILN